MQNLISLKHADLGYGSKKVLTGVEFDVRAGDFLGIVGPNGAGKTTLLKTLLGLIRPVSGSMERYSEELRIGYVPQRESVDSLFPLSVMDIVSMGRYSRIGPFTRINKREKMLALRSLTHMGISQLAEKAYPSLSGGQKQRTLIARALVGEPNLLILDEPTNGMDLAGEANIMGLLRDLHDKDGLTVLMVSHLLNTVINYVKRIAIVGDGSVQEGLVSEMITSGRLTELYGLGVKVLSVDSRLVLVPDNHGE